MMQAKSPSPEIDIVTLGCRLNTYESEQIHAMLKRIAPQSQKLCVVNTCTVTQSSKRQSQQAIRKLKRAHPEAQLIVTGCLAATEPEALRAMPEVDAIVPNAEKTSATPWESLFGSGLASPKTPTSDRSDDRPQSRARAFVRIQTGCDHRCTFCIIPHARGDSVSIPAADVVADISGLLAAGYADITLTGVDISAWGDDLPGTPKLAELLETILASCPELTRLRLSSLDCIELDARFIDLFGRAAQLMPYLHLSLQSGSRMILKRMRRRHSPEQALEFCQQLRAARPDIVFGADVIAGFPTETDQHFQETVDFIRQADIPWLHVFPYSPRSGTPAARMPQVPQPVIKQRAQFLRDLGNERAMDALERQVGKIISLTCERSDAHGLLYGRSEHYSPVVVYSPDTPIARGDHIRATVTATIAPTQTRVSTHRGDQISCPPASMPRAFAVIHAA